MGRVVDRDVAPPGPGWARPRAASAAAAIGVLLSSLALGSRASAAPLVVVDPGHGGSEVGTRSASGLEEKTLALAIAQALRRELEAAGVRVRLTRSDDRVIPLPARPALADEVGADAFVSIHLNHAADVDRRGWETYVLSAEASDPLARHVLAQEEGALVPDARGSAAAPALELILGDLARGVAHERSARLARAIQDEVAGVPGLAPSRGLRQAPFAVLAGARVPAVLVEVAYLSNETQAAFVGSKAGQKAAAGALARGILSFLRSRD